MMERRPVRSKNTLKRTLVKKMDSTRDAITEQLIHITNAMNAHIEADAKAFAEQSAAILEVNRDVKSLLASRSFLRGTWFAIVTVGTLIGVVAGLVVAWYRP